MSIFIHYLYTVHNTLSFSLLNQWSGKVLFHLPSSVLVSLEALPVDNTGAGLIVFFLCDPHAGKGRE